MFSGQVEQGPAGCSMEEVDHVFASPLTSTPRQHPNSSKAPKLGKTSLEDSSNRISQDLEKLPARCDHCGFIGHFGNHLRENKACIVAYRADPVFNVGGNDDEFVTRACLLGRKCPCPSCPGGSHWRLPRECLAWWIGFGWKDMHWKGVTADSTSGNIQEKIRKFRSNHCLRKTGGINIHSEASNTGEGASLKAGYQDDSVQGENSGRHCAFCIFSGSLAAHLQTAICLDHYKKTHLPRRLWQQGLRKSIFDLSLSLSPTFCPNPDCSISHLSSRAIAQIHHPCSPFIMSEVAAVYGCDTRGSVEVALGKLKRRQTYLREVLRNESLNGPLMLRKEISKMMTRICSTCIIQGPMTGIDEYKMEECIGTSPTLWQCRKCSASEDRQKDNVQDAEENIDRLLSLMSDFTLEAVEVKDSGDHINSRIVFMPKSFASNTSIQEEGQVVDPKRTTVLVPKHPDALDVFGEESMDEAFKARHELKRLAEFISKRPIFVHLNTALTLLQRKKLAEIKEARLTMWQGMNASSKGQILSRNPNIGDIKKRNSHFNGTKACSLTETCPWSEGHIQQKSEESAAIAWANGQVKTEEGRGMLMAL